MERADRPKRFNVPIDTGQDVSTSYWHLLDDREKYKAEWLERSGFLALLFLGKRIDVNWVSERYATRLWNGINLIARTVTPSACVFSGWKHEDALGFDFFCHQFPPDKSVQLHRESGLLTMFREQRLAVCPLLKEPNATNTEDNFTNAAQVLRESFPRELAMLPRTIVAPVEDIFASRIWDLVCCNPYISALQHALSAGFHVDVVEVPYLQNRSESLARWSSEKERKAKVFDAVEGISVLRVVLRKLEESHPKLTNENLQLATRMCKEATDDLNNAAADLKGLVDQSEIANVVNVTAEIDDLMEAGQSVTKQHSIQDKWRNRIRDAMTKLRDCDPDDLWMPPDPRNPRAGTIS